MNAMSGHNNKAIVVYVDNNPKCLEEFTWLYKTWRLWNVDQEFDLVAFCNPQAVKNLPEICDGLVVRELPPIQETDAFWRSYPFANSFMMFNNFSEYKFVKEKYSHIMRTDCDTFLTKNILGHAPARMMLGMGGYMRIDETSGETAKNLDRLRKKWGLKNNHITHVGASLFGPTSYVLIASIKHFLLTKEILTSEWSEGLGDWKSGWYAGVSSMYAIDLAVNDIFNRQMIIPCALDELCWKEIPITKSTLHIHAWHSTQYFSKHQWFEGKYSRLVLDRVPDSAGEYCHWIASNTLDDLREVVRATGGL